MLALIGVGSAPLAAHAESPRAGRISLEQPPADAAVADAEGSVFLAGRGIKAADMSVGLTMLCGGMLGAVLVLRNGGPWARGIAALFGVLGSGPVNGVLLCAAMSGSSSSFTTCSTR